MSRLKLISKSGECYKHKKRVLDPLFNCEQCDNCGTTLSHGRYSQPNEIHYHMMYIPGDWWSLCIKPLCYIKLLIFIQEVRYRLQKGKAGEDENWHKGVQALLADGTSSGLSGKSKVQEVRKGKIFKYILGYQ